MNLDQATNLDRRIKDIFDDIDDLYTDIMSTIQYSETVGAKNTSSVLRSITSDIYASKSIIEDLKNKVEDGKRRLSAIQ